MELKVIVRKGRNSSHMNIKSLNPQLGIYWNYNQAEL